MADNFIGKVSVTPVVTLTADDDADAVDRIHHDIKSSLGASISWDFSKSEVGSTPRWYYSDTGIANSVSEFDAISGATSSAQNYTDGTSTSASDDVRIVYIEHMGVDQNGITSVANDQLLVNLQGDAVDNASVLMLEPNEHILKMV